MIKVFSGITDWNFASKVENWLQELGTDYDVYDCKITSAYDSDAHEIYVTAVFFYTRGAMPKYEVEKTDKISIDYDLKNKDDWAVQFVKFCNEKQKDNLKIDTNKINEPKKTVRAGEVDWVGLLDRLSEVICDSSVDLSEPYASGRRKR